MPSASPIECAAGTVFRKPEESRHRLYSTARLRGPRSRDRGRYVFGGSLMTEPDQIEFHEHVTGPDGGRPGPSLSRPVPVRIGVVAGSAHLFVVRAVAEMGAW